MFFVFVIIFIELCYLCIISVIFCWKNLLLAIMVTNSYNIATRKE